MDEQTLWPVGAFEDAFRAHYRNLVRLVTPVTGEAAQAEEVAADALWKLYQHPELLAPGNSIGGWLYRTAMRMALDRRRSRKRRERTVSALRESSSPAVGRPAAGPLEAIVRRERVARVRRALGRLRPAQARMLLLRYEGAPYREVAAAAGVQPASVGTLLGRAETAFSKQFDFQSI